MKELVFALQFKGKGPSSRRGRGKACGQDDRGRPSPAHGTDIQGRPGQGGIQTGSPCHL